MNKLNLFLDDIIETSIKYNLSVSDVIQAKIAMEIQAQNKINNKLNPIDELVTLVDIFRDISLSLKTIADKEN